MTSAIPYDPEEEFDNNPFASPFQATLSESAPVENPQSEPVQEDVQEEEHTREVDPQEELFKLLPERKEPNKYKMLVRVTDIERAGSVTNKKENPTVIFDVSTNLPSFRRKSHKGLKKTYSEFTTFCKYLNGANPETFIPALPIPSTNYGINNHEDHVKTLMNFQEWFNRVTSDPIVLRNEELAFFIDSDLNTYQPVHKSRLPASGLKRHTLKQLQPPYDDTDLAEFRPLVKSIHVTAQNVQKILSRMGRMSKSLATQENTLGERLAEIEGPLQPVWHKFGRTITAVGDLQSIVATLDQATLYDGLEAIAQDTYMVKEALTNRHLLMRDLINAQNNTKVKHDNARKLRSRRDINPLKVDDAIKQLHEATNAEQALTLKVKRITENMLIERVRFLEWLEGKLQDILKECILKKIEYERKKLALLERIRTDIRKADRNGGLSRLGRDGLPKLSALSLSQGPDGDAWSGDRAKSHFKEEVLVLPSMLDDGATQKLENEDGDEYKNEMDHRFAASMLGGSSF